MSKEMDASQMSIDEIKAHLRKDYGRWPWQAPKKKDRCLIAEWQWSQIDWTEEEQERNIALPHKMWNMRHDDWLWPRSYAWRGDDAYGSRAPEGHPKHMPELPQLVEGRGIARWMAAGDASVVEVPELADYRKVWTPDNLPEIIEFWERRPGHKDFYEGHDRGRLIRWAKKNFLRTYAPSSLQKFSKRSLLIRNPYHFSRHIMVHKNELFTGDYKPDWVFLYRRGWRWDSYDGYMKKGFYTGLRWN